jgi:asparagine synthase (glutamine-hydrolysing)
LKATADVELTPLEIASGLLLGSSRTAVDLAHRDASRSSRAALEDAIRPALQRPPCLVSFSGGRDSSAVLAVAAHVARREGLAPPVAFTLRFPGAPDSDEAEWQERVISHLRLDDWVRRDLDDELDCIGFYARAAINRHGLLWPFNAHFVAPAAEAANGGSVLTGAGGDQIFAFSRLERHRDLLARHVRPRPRDALRLAYMLGPAPLRRAVVRRRTTDPLELPWLRPAAKRAVAAAIAANDASEPVRTREHLRWILGLRALRVGVACFELVARDYGASLGTPLLEPGFAATLTREPGRSFYMDRTRAMRALVGDLLPADVCERTSKAVFQDPFWNRHARAFVEHWDGRGVDEALVDADALRDYWRSPEPVAQSMTLLQSAWLATRGPAGSDLLGQPVEEEPARPRE